MPRIAIIDGGELAFRAALGNSVSVDWDGDGSKVLSTVPPAEAQEAARNLVEAWRKKVHADGVRIAMTKGVNFRTLLDPTYKANRPPKPDAYLEVELFLRSEYRILEEDGLEADDILGIHSRSDRAEVWIVSSDKDLLTIPYARLYRPHRDSKERIQSNAADYRWMLQTLTGDPSDGYKGCPRIGPIKAEAILARAGHGLVERWCAVVEAFVAAGLTKDDAVLQARLARILRPGDLKDGRISLWDPHKPTFMEQSECRRSPASPAPTPASPPTSGPAADAASSANTPPPQEPSAEPPPPGRKPRRSAESLKASKRRSATGPA